ncbi:hypothetical protein [Reyranella soli]|uniref:hypothetical protein n=1 Tax=Reyranella soli TaxID=1230389 RepID=UPI0011BE7B84|nr:hypothetical protein [Reyranella soli]
MNKSIPLLAVAIGFLVAGSVAEPAMARMGGSFGNGGGLSGSMSSGSMSSGSMSSGMSSPATQAPSAQSFAPMTSSGMGNSNAGSNSSNVFRSLDSPIPGIANTPSP